MQDKRILQPGLSLLLIIATVMVLSACSGLNSKKKSSSSDPGAVQKSEASAATYYDFGDVLLPKQLKIDNGKSFIFSVSGVTAGVLSLKGRVEIISLLNFFENKMPVDGWTLENKFRGARSMLLFTKLNRNCVITIDEGAFNTLVEVWVAPTAKGNVSGLHK